MINSRFIKTLRHTWVMTLQAESMAPGSSTEVVSVECSYVCSRCGAQGTEEYKVYNGKPYSHKYFMRDPNDHSEWIHDKIVEALVKMKVRDYTCESVLMDEALG